MQGEGWRVQGAGRTFLLNSTNLNIKIEFQIEGQGEFAPGEPPHLASTASTPTPPHGAPPSPPSSSNPTTPPLRPPRPCPDSATAPPPSPAFIASTFIVGKHTPTHPTPGPNNNRPSSEAGPPRGEKAGWGREARRRTVPSLLNASAAKPPLPSLSRGGRVSSTCQRNK